MFERFTRCRLSMFTLPVAGFSMMALVREIALAHQGTAIYRPQPGGGAVFELRLPL